MDSLLVFKSANISQVATFLSNVFTSELIPSQTQKHRA